MDRILGPLIVHALLCVFTWLGFDQGVAGAANLVIFAVWLALVPVGLLAAFGVRLPGVAIKAAAKPPIPGWLVFINRTARWLCLGLLVWHGAWVTAIGVLVFMAGNALAHQAIEEARKKISKPSSAQAVGEAA